MTHESIRAQIETIVRTELRREDDIPENAQLAEHLDSIQQLALVVAIEDHFEVAFEPEDDEQAHTLDDVVNVVARRLGVQGA
jgi:acyl carrier protein